MTKAFVGIDVAFAKDKRLPVSVCTMSNGRLIPLPLGSSDCEPPRGSGNVKAIDPNCREQFAKSTVSYLKAIESTFSVSIARIAIDAPSAPRQEMLSQRTSEAALKCSYIKTPSESEFNAKIERARDHVSNGRPESRLPAANQLWMLVGFSLFDELRQSWECIEVFPQATMCALGAARLHKSNTLGLQEQFHAVSRYTGWPAKHSDTKKTLREIAKSPSHDALDAYSAAWVASLEDGQREALGNEPNDTIWIPKVRSLVPWNGA